MEKHDSDCCYSILAVIAASAVISISWIICILWLIKLVFNSLVRGYAEMVERRLKTVGLVVDVQIHGATPLTELLDSVARKGVLYAIVITSQHEVHRSVTVNILHGTPQGNKYKVFVYCLFVCCFCSKEGFVHYAMSTSFILHCVTFRTTVQDVRVWVVSKSLVCLIPDCNSA